MRNFHGILYDVTGELITSPDPGQDCALCKRRVKHPKKSDSPKTSVKSFRVPEDDTTFTEDFALACNIVGIDSAMKFPIYKFVRGLINVVNTDPDSWAGAYTDGKFIP